MEITSFDTNLGNHAIGQHKEITQLDTDLRTITKLDTNLRESRHWAPT